MVVGSNSEFFMVIFLVYLNILLKNVIFVKFVILFLRVLFIEDIELIYYSGNGVMGHWGNGGWIVDGG